MDLPYLKIVATPYHVAPFTQLWVVSVSSAKLSDRGKPPKLSDHLLFQRINCYVSVSINKLLCLCVCSNQMVQMQYTILLYLYNSHALYVADSSTFAIEKQPGLAWKQFIPYTVAQGWFQGSLAVARVPKFAVYP